MRRLLLPSATLLALIATLITALIVIIVRLARLTWLSNSVLLTAGFAKVTVVLHQTNGNMRSGTVVLHLQLELSELGISETDVVAHELNLVEKSVATICTTAGAIGQLFVHFRCFTNWPNFVSKLDSGVETKQNVCTTAKLFVG